MKKKLTKKQLEAKKQQAYLLFMSGEDQASISGTIKISENSISKWVNEGKWKSKRSAATVTRDELVNKCLVGIGELLDKVISGEKVDGLEDKLAKFAKTIETLDKKNNVVYNMATFTGFNKYLLERMRTDKTVEPDVVKRINQLQNDYITYRMNE